MKNMYNETFRRLLETYDLWFVGKSNEDASQLEFTFNKSYLLVLRRIILP